MRDACLYDFLVRIAMEEPCRLPDGRTRGAYGQTMRSFGTLLAILFRCLGLSSVLDAQVRDTRSCCGREPRLVRGVAHHVLDFAA